MLSRNRNHGNDYQILNKKKPQTTRHQMGLFTIKEDILSQVNKSNQVAKCNVPAVVHTYRYSQYEKDFGGIGNITIGSLVDSPSQMADIIEAPKSNINSLSAVAAKAQQNLDDLRCELTGIKNAKHINTMIDGLKANHPMHKQMKLDIWNTAKDIEHIEFENQSKRFIDVVKEEPIEVKADEVISKVNAETEKEVADVE